MSTKPSLVILARIGRPHGVRGALHVDQAGAHLGHFAGHGVYVGNEQQSNELKLERVDTSTVQFAGIHDRDAAAALTNRFILVPLDALKEIVQRERINGAPKIADLWYFELVGMQVIDAESQKPLGKISHVEDSGLNTLVSIEPGPGAELAKTLDIPLEFPHWHAPDLALNQIGLSEWRIFLD